MNTANYDLVELEEKHANEIFQLRSSDLINQYLDRAKAVSIDDAIGFIHKIRKAVAANESFFWVIAKKTTGEFTGTICLWNISNDRSSAEIGYELLPQFHGKGIMQEVIPRIIQFGFHEINLQKFEAVLSKRNLKSIRLLEKNGFNFEKNISEEEVEYVLPRKRNQD